jgi:hypothetical protein
LGVGLGFALGIPAASFPVVGMPLLGLGVTATLALGVGRPSRRASAFALCGGGLFLYGTLNTYMACIGTADFCGHTPIERSAGIAFVAICAGAIAGLASLRAGPSRHRLQSDQNCTPHGGQRT